MKKSVFLFLSFILSTFVAHAGNMFGPAAFRNGSPLPSGNDGTYQATARAENVTGIFRFAYSGGSQTTSASQNSWIFFVNGQIQKGTVAANIEQSSLDGIFDSSSSSTTANSNGAITLPYVTINQNNSSAGTFAGKLSLKNPNGAFNGSGNLSPLPAQTNLVVGVSQNDAGDFSFNGTAPPASFIPGAIVVNTGNYTIPAGSITPINFKFRGVRTSTSVTASSNSTAN